MTEEKFNENQIDVDVSTIDETPSLSDNTSRTEQPSVLKPLDLSKKGSPEMNTSNKLAIVFMVVAVVAGIGTGFGLNKLSAKSYSS